MKPLNACRWLNNKAFYCDPPDRTKRPEEYLTPFWCAKTHTPVGPDGGGVHISCCGSDRTCYRPQTDVEV